MKELTEKRFLFLSHLDFNLIRFRFPIMSKLISQGNEVYASCPQGKYIDHFKKNGVHYVPWACNRENKNPFYELYTLYDLIRILNHINPDVVHAFTVRPNLYSSFAKIFFLKKFLLINSVTGLGTLYTNTDDSSFKKYKSYIVDLAYKYAFIYSNAVILQNTDDFEHFTAHRIASSNKCHLFKGSGVKINKINQKENQKSNTINILLVARLIREKGIVEFCNAAKILKSKYRDKVGFTVVGGFDKGNPSYIDENELNDLNTQGIITFTGHQDDPSSFFKHSDIYCLPSYREGMPMTVLEAMSEGLPIVTTNAPGCRETVDEGINGFTVNIKDIDGLVERLSLLIENDSLRLEMGAASRKKAESEFNIDLVVDNHLQLYYNLLNQNSLP